MILTDRTRWAADELWNETQKTPKEAKVFNIICYYIGKYLSAVKMPMNIFVYALSLVCMYACTSSLCIVCTASSRVSSRVQPKKVKNISRTDMGDKLGRVHMVPQVRPSAFFSSLHHVSTYLTHNWGILIPLLPPGPCISPHRTWPNCRPAR
jgi:hypothetical protein